MASLGTRISECRKRRQITQEQLAEHMNVSPQAVSKWENDISCPDISLLPQLSDYFGVSIDELLRGEENSQLLRYEPNAAGDINRKMLRVIVHSHEGDEVKVNLPFALIKLGMAFVPMLNINGNQAVSDALENIDFDAIINMAETGVQGKIVEVKSADGDVVDIYIE